jgi:hypothetical protein
VLEQVDCKWRNLDPYFVSQVVDNESAVSGIDDDEIELYDARSA